MAPLAPTSVLPVVPRRMSLADRWALVWVPARSRAGVLRMAAVSGLSVPAAASLWWRVACGYEFRVDALGSGATVPRLCLWVLRRVDVGAGAGWLVCPACRRRVSIGPGGVFDAHAGADGLIGCRLSYAAAWPVVFGVLGRDGLVRRLGFWLRVQRLVAVQRTRWGHG